MAPPGPVKIGHKKDGRQRRPHRFHVSRPPPLPGRWIRYCILNAKHSVQQKIDLIIQSCNIMKYCNKSDAS